MEMADSDRLAEINQEMEQLEQEKKEAGKEVDAYVKLKYIII